MAASRNISQIFLIRQKTNFCSLINSFCWHLGSLIFVPSFNLYKLFNVQHFSLDFLFAGSFIYSVSYCTHLRSGLQGETATGGSSFMNFRLQKSFHACYRIIRMCIHRLRQWPDRSRRKTLLRPGKRQQNSALPDYHISSSVQTDVQMPGRILNQGFPE